MEDTYAAAQITLQMQTIEREFYQSNNINTMSITNKQKADLAVELCNNINMNDMCKVSFFAFQNDDCIYINYPILQKYVNLNSYEYVVQELLLLLQNTIQRNKNHSIHIHINVNGFTVSAAERYMYIMEHFFRVCRDCNIELTPHIASLTVYYAPSVMDTITIFTMMQKFIHKDIKSKIRIISSQTDSESHHGELSRVHDRAF